MPQLGETSFPTPNLTGNTSIQSVQNLEDLRNLQDDEIDKSRFVLTFLKNKVTQLESDINQKEAIINFLTNELLQTQSHKSHIYQN